jgi:hypothetical protein
MILVMTREVMKAMNGGTAAGFQAGWHGTALYA